MPEAHLPPLSPTLEVTQTTGDTVVSTHLIGGRYGKPPRASRRVLVILGGLFLALSAFVFARSVANSAANQAAEHQWVDVEKKPLYAFRPERLSIANDLLAFGGLAGALFCFVGALAIRRQGSDELLAGTDGGVGIAWAGQPTFTLAKRTDTGADILLPAGCVAIVRGTDGETREVQERAALTTSESLSFPCGLGFVHLRWTETPRALKLSGLLAMEGRTAKFIGASAIAHLGVLALLMTIPPDSRSLSSEREDVTGLLVEIRTDASEDPIVLPSESSEGGDDTADTADAADAAKGMATASAEGAKGDPIATREKTKAAIKRRADEPRLAQLERARTAGILGVLSRADFHSMMATSDFASGMSTEDMLGNDFNGTEFGIGRGPGGGFGNPLTNGISPFPGSGTIRTSGFPPGTRIGTSTGEDYARSIGGSGSKVRGHVSRDPIIKPGTPGCSVAGCDKTLIRRYIRRKRAQVRNCYERALISNPKLSGTVTARFLIHPNGKVGSARAGGIGDTKLESCVARVVSTISFPVVADGAVASVTYPFFMSQPGQ